MDKLTFRKGNLFNGLDNKFDNQLIDSSQYDLEITNGDKITYYRVRFLESFYMASEETPKEFVTSSYNKNGNGILEVGDFRKTQYFKNIFPYFREFNKAFYAEDRQLPSYYAFLQRINSKNNINTSEVLYRFSLPAIGERKKVGVLSYELEIELVRRRYFVIFYNEIMESGYIQREDPQHMIYDKKRFNAIKDKIDNDVLDLAIAGDYPLNLLEYLYVMTNGNVNLIAQFFRDLPKFKSYADLLNSQYLSLIRPSMNENEDLERELVKYFNGDQEDINYSFYNQRRVLKK